jgi:hypothetical protein
LPPRKVLPLLSELLDRRARAEKDIRRRRVVGRNADGSVRLQGHDAECVERGPEGPYYEGQVLEQPASPRFDVRGTTGISVLAGENEASMVLLDALDPREVTRDECPYLLLTGRGFRAPVEVEFQLPGGTREPNPDIEVVAVNVLDSETLEVDICVGAFAAITTGDLAVTTGGQTVVLTDAYDVVSGEAEEPPETNAAHVVAVDWRGPEWLYWTRWTVYPDDTSRMEIVRLPLHLTPPVDETAGVPVFVLDEAPGGSYSGGGGGGGA